MTKPTRHPLVKPARTWIAIVAAIFAISSVAHAASEPSGDDERLPDIEAKTFDVKVMRRSRSGNVYVFETSEEQPLHTGKILLLREGIQPVMAFRVLRDYSDKNQFAAKWVRRYRGIDQLNPSTSYLAIEKIADREAPPLTVQDRAELKEVESEIPPPTEQTTPAKKFDSELDATTSPPPKSVAETSSPDLTPADVQEIDELKDFSAEELVVLDRDKNWTDMGYSIFRQNGAGPQSYSGYFSGFDFRWPNDQKSDLFKEKRHPRLFRDRGLTGLLPRFEFRRNVHKRRLFRGPLHRDGALQRRFRSRHHGLRLRGH